MSKVRSIMIVKNNPGGIHGEFPFPAVVRRAVWQLEIGEKGTPHLQMCVQFNNSVSLKGLSLVFPNCNIQPTKKFDASWKYCQKEDTRSEGPWFYGEEYSPERGKRTDLMDLMDVVKKDPKKRKYDLMEDYPDVMAKYPRFVAEYRSMTQSSQISPLRIAEATAQWQLDLFDILSAQADRRKVHWIWSTNGSTGKSKTAQMIKDNFNGLVVSTDKKAEIYYIYDFQPVVVFDLPRCTDNPYIYGMIEDFKNGRVTSTKYEPVVKEFYPPHVVIFSNSEPLYEKLSSDRWNVICID